MTPTLLPETKLVACELAEQRIRAGRHEMMQSPRVGGTLDDDDDYGYDDDYYYYYLYYYHSFHCMSVSDGRS